MSNTQVIGLSGTNGSGKDTVGHMMAERHNFLFISVTELLREEAKKRGLPVEREHLRTISAEWRREGGLGVLVDRAYEAFQEAQGTYDGVIMASLRNPGEADRVHELGGIVVWVDADPKVRYSRVYSRQRTAEDDKTYEQFLAEEAAEMQRSGDEATLNMSGVKEKSDIFLENDGNNIEQFKDEAEQALGFV